MAISSYGITLKHGTSGSSLTKLVDIKNTPALGGEPELLETTTLSDAMQTYIAGIQSMEAMTFTANYTLTEFKAIQASADKAGFYALEFGEAGADGVFEWQGSHSVYVNETEVNGVVEMTITVVPSTEVKLKEE